MSKTAEEILAAFKEPFPPEVIHWRIGMTNSDKTSGVGLAYLNARDIMKRLDDVVGWDNWQCTYPFSGCCELSVRIDDDWITKSNCADVTQVEAIKGQASDALKRAAVLFGIGRYLYYLDNEWVQIEPAGKSHKLVRTPSLPSWALPKKKEDK